MAGLAAPEGGICPVARLGPFTSGFHPGFRPIGHPLSLWAFGAVRTGRRRADPLYCAVVVGLCVSVWRILRSRVVAGLTIAVLIGVAVQPKFSLEHVDLERVALDQPRVRGHRRVVAVRGRADPQARWSGVGSSSSRARWPAIQRRGRGDRARADRGCLIGWRAGRSTRRFAAHSSSARPPSC